MRYRVPSHFNWNLPVLDTCLHDNTSCISSCNTSCTISCTHHLFSFVLPQNRLCDTVRLTFESYLLTYSMVQSPFWEANSFAASQEIPRISLNPNVPYRTHKRLPPVSILDHLLEIHPNIIHPSTPRSPHLSPSIRFSQQDHIHPPLQSKHHACECLLTECFYREGLLAPRPTPSWKNTPRRLSATAYSIYSQLPYLSVAVPLSATWGRAMPWWQGPSTWNIRIIKSINL